MVMLKAWSDVQKMTSGGKGIRQEFIIQEGIKTLCNYDRSPGGCLIIVFVTDTRMVEWMQENT